MKVWMVDYTVINVSIITVVRRECNTPPFLIMSTIRKFHSCLLKLSACAIGT